MLNKTKNNVIAMPHALKSNIKQTAIKFDSTNFTGDITIVKIGCY